MRKNIVVLGSSGSIGENTLEVARTFGSKVRVVGLSVGSRVERLKEQISEFRPAYACVADTSRAKDLKAASRRTRVFEGRQGLCEMASLKEADIIVIAIVGFEAVFPLLAAIKAGKTIALANKESIVVAGGLVMEKARANGSRIIPIDSEQSAIFQCLQGYRVPMVRNIFLTASGGPLVDRPRSKMRSVPVRVVLAHPKWKMGPKISVDSATMMNKGLEVIESMHLFGIPTEKIKVLIHREAVVHSMVEFRDGSILAQMGETDMKLPIQYALSWPERWENKCSLDPLRLDGLDFTFPDTKKFPCLSLAYEASKLGGCAPCALNAANETAVGAFLRKELRFGRIASVIEKVLARFSRWPLHSVSDICDSDNEARRLASNWIEYFSKKDNR